MTEKFVVIRSVSILVLMFLTFYSAYSWSFSYQNIVTLQLCAKKEMCTTSESEFKNNKVLQCEMQKQAHRCEELKVENPSWAPLIKSCDWDNICKDLQEYERSKQLACMRGYANAAIDLGIAIKDMGVSLVGFVEDSWENIKKNNRERTAFLKECDKSLACKRDLIKDDHRYNALSDEKLAGMSATFLYVEAQQLEMWTSSAARARPPKYVPLSERGARNDEQEESLSSEQKDKLKSLINIAKEKIQTQYDRYNCYTEIAQEELACYAIGTVFDPTLAAGYFFKGARVASAAGKALKTETALVQTTVRLVTQRELKGQYVQFSPTSIAQNEAWIAKAEASSRSRIFFDVENSQLKHLNDTLKDKDLVTGLTNFHKDILFKKVKALETANPGLVVSSYSDFKSSRFAFEGKVPADIEAQLAKILKESNQEFTQSVSAMRELQGTENWFRAGLGKTADEANVAARYSRQVADNELQRFSNSTLTKSLESKMAHVEAERSTLRQQFAGTGLLENNGFHQDVFDLARKNADPQQLEIALKGRFALESVPSGSIEKLQTYVRAVDEFSPGIHVAKREVATLSEAQYGGLSADIIGLGGANLKATANALADSKNLAEALEKTRRAEKAVTSDFIAQKNFYENTVARSVEPGKLRTVCSGDDCVSTAIAPLTAREKEKIVQEIASSKYSGTFRFSFVSDGVRNQEARTILSTHGESLEKTLRASLATSIEPNKLRGLTFGVDLKTKELNRGPVRLIVGEGDNLRLTQRERTMIEERFEEAVKAFNSKNRSRYRTEK